MFVCMYVRMYVSVYIRLCIISTEYVTLTFDDNGTQVGIK